MQPIQPLAQEPQFQNALIPVIPLEQEPQFAAWENALMRVDTEFSPFENAFIKIGERMHIEPQRMPFPISQEQKARIDRYIDNLYFTNKCKRVFDFYEDNTDRSLILKERVERAGIIGLGIGGLWGGFATFLGREGIKRAVAACIAPQATVAITTIEAVGYVIAGTLLGGFAGNQVGKTLAATITILYDVQTDAYCEWRMRAINEKVYPIFERVVMDERTQLRQFTCPITEKLILCPYCTKNGQVFEKAAVISWLEERKRAGENTEYNGETIEEKKLRYDWTFHPRLYEQLIKILDTNVELYREYIPEEARQGLMAFKDSIQNPTEEILEKLRGINGKMRLKKIISDEELERRDREVMKHYEFLYSGNR